MIEGLPPSVRAQTVFVAWGPPSHANRTRVLAKSLGIEVRHIYSTQRRGALAAPIKYPYQAFATMLYLFHRRPKIVFVQNPPSFAMVFVAIYTALTGAEFVVDAHTDAFTSSYWTRPAWLYRLVARRARVTIVTNDHLADLIRRRQARACVLRDIPTQYKYSDYELGTEFNVAVVSTFAGDEPTAEVVAAARSMPEVRFRVTGDTGRENASIPTSLPTNVELTGFLPLDDYYGLLHQSDAVMSLTTRNHTMQRGACEALSLGTPIITSDWPLLEDYFCAGTVHVDNTVSGIRDGVDRMRTGLEGYRREIDDLRRAVDAEWEVARAELVDILLDAIGPAADAHEAPTELARGHR